MSGNIQNVEARSMSDREKREQELQQARREVLGMFAVFITTGAFAAMIAAFIWMFWVAF